MIKQKHFRYNYGVWLRLMSLAAMMVRRHWHRLHQNIMMMWRGNRDCRLHWPRCCPCYARLGMMKARIRRVMSSLWMIESSLIVAADRKSCGWRRMQSRRASGRKTSFDVILQYRSRKCDKRWWLMLLLLLLLGWRRTRRQRRRMMVMRVQGYCSCCCCGVDGARSSRGG